MSYRLAKMGGVELTVNLDDSFRSSRMWLWFLKIDTCLVSSRNYRLSRVVGRVSRPVPVWSGRETHPTGTRVRLPRPRVARI